MKCWLVPKPSAAVGELPRDVKLLILIYYIHVAAKSQLQQNTYRYAQERLEGERGTIIYIGAHHRVKDILRHTENGHCCPTTFASAYTR